VLAVHEPTVNDATNVETFEVLRRLVDKGLVRALSIAGNPDSIEAAVLAGVPIAFAQFPDTPFTDAAARLRTSLPAPAPAFVIHGVFGSGIADALAGMNAQRRGSITALAESHGIDFAESPHDLLVRFAFSNNPDGVVIISMFDTKHIERNIAAASLPPIRGFAKAVRNSIT
jgi:aryl-alcohol dehydrogenase-like predicted oxidoreductase